VGVRRWGGWEVGREIWMLVSITKISFFISYTEINDIKQQQ
jgi:hypothetical protein